MKDGLKCKQKTIFDVSSAMLYNIAFYQQQNILAILIVSDGTYRNVDNTKCVPSIICVNPILIFFLV